MSISPSQTPPSSVTYADAGVSIDAGNSLVERIKPLAKSTSRRGSMSSLGGFGALFDMAALGYRDPILVSTTDGVGTKLKLAIYGNLHDTIGIDLVAMCVNDLIVQGAEPLFFLDYFATSRLSVDKGEAIIRGIAEGCRQAGCALVGGETAEMPGMYHDGDYDLAGFAVGVVEREGLLPVQTLKEGDVILGLASSGVHSNGYSLVRYLVEKNGLDWNAPSGFIKDKTLLEALLTPTRIYVKSCLAAIREPGSAVKALAHITGGGLTENIPRVLPEGLAAEIHLNSWHAPEVFHWLFDTGNIEQEEMLRTFNCGIGMVMVVDKAQSEQVIATLSASGEKVFTLGSLISRTAQPVVYI